MKNTYCIVTNFQTTSLKKCEKLDNKNYKIYAKLQKKKNKVEKIMESTPLITKLDIPELPNPNNKEKYKLWKKRIIKRPVIEQSKAIVFLQEKGLVLDIDYEAYQAIPLYTKLNKNNKSNIIDIKKILDTIDKNDTNKNNKTIINMNFTDIK
jgi:hypothetical protein